MSITFTERVREELAHLPVGPACCQDAETAALVRHAGALLRHGGGPADGASQTRHVVVLTTNAVVRRLHATLTARHGVRPVVEVHEPTALRPTTYRLLLPAPAEPVLRALGVLDRHGRPTDRPPGTLVRRPHDAAAYVRGALMAAGSVSDPRQAAHLEIRAAGAGSALLLRALVTRCGGTGARALQRADGWRVVCKSGADIGAVLARAGAHAAFLRWDGARLERELRGAANRSVNADRANLARAVGAAERQIAAIEALVTRWGWQSLPDDLRTTALARVANPEASLAELGALHDPPVGKAAVHRRLTRLAALADTPANAPVA